MSFLARKKSLESIAVFVVTLEDDDEEAAVYVWEIKGQRYAVYGTSKYERLIPSDTAHYLYRKVSRTHIRYPTVPTEEEKLVFLDEEETIPIHNPFQEVGHELDHHWVPFAEGETAQITLKADQYRTDGYCILVSGTGATEGNLSIFLWAVGLHEDGTVGYAHREEDDDSNEEMEQQDMKQEAEGTEEGQSAGTPPAEPPKVQFHHYNHVQAFSTDDGNLIGEEEDHSMKEGNLQREQSEHSFENEDTDRDQDGESVQSRESNSQSKSSKSSSSSSSVSSSSKASQETHSSTSKKSDVSMEEDSTRSQRSEDKPARKGKANTDGGNRKGRKANLTKAMVEKASEKVNTLDQDEMEAKEEKSLPGEGQNE